MLITVAVAFAVVYRETDAQLSGQIDREIQTSADGLAQAIDVDADESPAAVLTRAHAYIRAQPYRDASILLFVIVAGHGTVSNHPELVTTGDPDADETEAQQRVENAEAERIRRLPAGFSTAQGSDVGSLRIHVARTGVADGTQVVIGAAEPLEATRRALAGVAQSFAIAGAFAFLLAIGFAALIGSRVSAPLRQTANVAARVDAGDLTPRLTLGPNTSVELRTLTDAFNHMLDRLAAAFDAQRDFVGDASHELRTPITVIRGQLDLLAVTSEDALAGRSAPVAPEEILRVEALIQAEIARITRLTDDLLVLAQAEQSSFLHPTDVEIASFITDLWDGLTLTAERRFEIGTLEPCVAIVDPDRLAQALRNIGRNAIAHTHAPDGIVRVDAAHTDSHLRIVVSDDGPGIPEAQRERVFERFYRTDTGRARARGGAGLGLPIVKAIVEAHGGTVSVAAADIGGARFTITLPLPRH